MGKKVLLSLPEYSSFYPGIRRAFEHMGFEVANFDFRKFNGLEKMMTISGKKKAAYKSLNRRLCSFASAWHPDIFLTIKGETIFHDTIKMLKNNGIKTVNWFPDGLWKLDLILDLISDYDVFFHFDSLVYDKLKSMGYKNVKYLPYAADILPLDKIPKFDNKKYPLTFIGNFYPEREKYFSKISQMPFNIWGDKTWKNSSLCLNYRGVLPFPKVMETLARSIVSVNLHYKRSKSNGANLRVYESTAAGSCLLTDFKKDVVDMYEDGREIVVFNDIKDFINKSQLLINDVKLAREIGIRGYKKSKGYHTYVHRIKKILDIIYKN